MIASLADIVRTHNRERPDAPALSYAGDQLSFGQLYERSCRVAQALAASGVGPSDRVAFLDKNCLEYFEVTFGLALLNAVNVAVNWRLAPREIAQVIADSGAQVVIVGAEFVDAFDSVRDAMPAVKHVVVIGETDAHTPYDEWVWSFDAVDPGVVAGRDDIAFQLYTSGTTGLPKGAMLTNANFFTKVEGTAGMWHFDDASVNLAMMPMFHIAGAAWAAVGMIYGCLTVVLRDVVPADIVDAVQSFGVTNVMMVPAVLQPVVELAEATNADLSSLRTLVYGASPISAAALQRAVQTLGCDFIQLYGLTETCGAITQLDGADHDPDNRPHLLRSCGRPFPWVELRVVDEAGADAGPSAVGEIWTRSNQNMVGYWNNPEATAAAFAVDGWFRTGDAGYLDADGFLFLHDRVKDMIVSGGENVYPAEVENALMEHTGLAEVAVIGVPDDRWGEAVKAIVVARDTDDVPTGEELIAHCHERLAGFKTPKTVEFTDVLPRNPSGKLLKRVLREPYWAGHERRV